MCTIFYCPAIYLKSLVDILYEFGFCQEIYGKRILRESKDMYIYIIGIICVSVSRYFISNEILMKCIIWNESCRVERGEGNDIMEI